MSESVRQIGYAVLVASDWEAFVGDSKEQVLEMFTEYLRQNPDMVAQGFRGIIHDIDLETSGFYGPKENTKATIWHTCEDTHESGACEGQCYEEMFINLFQCNVFGMRSN